MWNIYVTMSTPLAIHDRISMINANKGMICNGFATYFEFIIHVQGKS